MKITKIRVNNIEKPMGFDINPVSFSWVVEEADGAQKQEYARVVVKKGNIVVFDSGEDKNADSLDYRADLKLEARTRYTAHIAVKADNGEIAEGHSFLETGKMNEAWKAKWITSNVKTNTGIVFSKTVNIDKDLDEARIYCCALGVYELYINGKKVGNEYLAPGYHSYDFHLQTQTYDIAEYLKLGENKIEFHVGDGWFKGRLGFDGGFTDIYGDRCYAIGEIYIKNTDGSITEVFTDKTWKYKKSAVVFSSIYDGEIYDARLEKENDWNEVVEKDPEGCGKLTDRYSLPVVKRESFKPVKLIETSKGERVLDFGQNMTGWVEFECDLDEGKEITLTASEIMQDGCFYHENLRTAKTEFKYISDGRKTHVRPHFTFFGFRYMKIECDGKIDINDFTAYHLRSDFDQIGFINTGNEKVNQLFSNALWSQKDNFLDVPTDCPQRDERLGWTGDAQIFSATACYNMYMPSFYRKYLWDMRAEQSILGGSVPNVVPRLKKGMVAEHGACPWADAGVIIPWNVYLHYGNKTLLEETYPGMKAWVDCQRKREEAIEGPHLVKDGFHFADWLALDNEQPGPFGATDPLFIASAYYYRCADIVAKSAAALGKQEEAEEYKNLSSQILKALQEKYFDKDGNCTIKTQTASAITIEFGLMKGMEKNEGNALNERVRLKDNHLDTGFVGTPLLCPALTRSGHNETAVTLLLNETYPSWLYSVNLGATTIWERWNSVLEDGSLNPEGMNSLNHYSYGSIEEWMYKDVCGINNAEGIAGFRKAVIKPHADIRLQHAEGTLNTSAGTYKSSWSVDYNGFVTYEIEIPFNAEAEVILPEGKYVINGIDEVKFPCILLSGKYKIEEI